MTNLRTVKRQGFFWLGTFAILLVTVVFGVILLNNVTFVETVKSVNRDYGWGFSVWRLCLYSVLIAFWPQCISLITRNSTHTSKTRYSLLLLILCYELLIVQNVLAFLLKMFLG